MDRKYLPDRDSSASELIPGKRYRWTVEGTAKNGQYLSLQDGKDMVEALWLRLYGNLELLPDPLPTTPGSVIAWAGRLYVRVIPTSSEVFVWTPLDNLGHYLEEDYRLQGATVLFDAGTK